MCGQEETQGANGQTEKDEKIGQREVETSERQREDGRFSQDVRLFRLPLPHWLVSCKWMMYAPFSVMLLAFTDFELSALVLQSTLKRGLAITEAAMAGPAAAPSS